MGKFGSIKTKFDLDTRGSLNDEDLLNAPEEKGKKGRPPKENVSKRTLNFDIVLWKKLRAIAFENETTITEIIHQACYEWLDRRGKDD